MIRRRIPAGVALISGWTALGSAGNQPGFAVEAGNGDQVAARLSLRLDGSLLVDQEIVGSVSPSGNVTFSKQMVVEGVTIDWLYVVDPDPTDGGKLNGRTIIVNALLKVIDVEAEFAVPLCPTIRYDPAQGHPKPTVGGSASVRINANSDGGSITCAPDSKHLDVTLLTAAEVLVPLFHCPFELALSGSGSALTTTEFGSPYPSMKVSAPIAQIGHRVAITLTPGDKATMGLLYLVAGHVEQPNSICPSDVNGDGVVDGGDLALVLDAFGMSVACGNPVDVDGGGSVDAADLVKILLDWENCGGAGGPPG